MNETKKVNTAIKSKTSIKKLVMAAICLSMCIVLPFLTGQIPKIGSALSPMHIPVLICGFVCGWQYGMAIGFVAPLLRSFMFGSPPMLAPFPIAPAMAFELLTYGLIAGLLYKLLPKKAFYIYPILIISMLAGRVVWGSVMFVMAATTIMNSGPFFPFTLSGFITGAFINSSWGIALHIIAIPPIIIAIKKAGYILND